MELRTASYDTTAERHAALLNFSAEDRMEDACIEAEQARRRFFRLFRLRRILNRIAPGLSLWVG